MTYEYSAFQYAFMTLLVFLIALCYLDENVSHWLILQTKLAVIRVRMAWMMFWLHPKNPVYTWQYNRRINKMIQELQNGTNSSDLS